jgi:hypothetical protein
LDFGRPEGTRILDFGLVLRSFPYSVIRNS